MNDNAKAVMYGKCAYQLAYEELGSNHFLTGEARKLLAEMTSVATTNDLESACSAILPTVTSPDN
jgi:hypothetical protein